MTKTWRERTVEARQRGFFTGAEKSMAEGSWEACKIGEERRAHPEVVVYRNLDAWSGPVDPVLRELGSSFEGFGAAVVADDFDEVERLMDQIEDRVLVLKQRMVLDVNLNPEKETC